MAYIAKVSGADVVELRVGVLTDIPEADRVNWRSVIESLPLFDRATQAVDVGSIDVINDTVVMTYTIKTVPAVLAKMRLRDQAAAARWKRTQSGVTLPSGVRIKTDETSKAKIDQALAMLEKGWTSAINWKVGTNEYATLDLAAMTGVAQAVAAYEQACFETEKSIIAEIEAGTITTVAQIDGYAWP